MCIRDSSYAFGGQSYVHPEATLNLSKQANASPIGAAPDVARATRVTYPWPSTLVDGKIIIAKA